MGIITDFFMAAEKDALEYRSIEIPAEERRRRYKPAEWKGVVDLNVSILWAILTDEEWDPDDHELTLVSGEDETFLFRIPSELISLLSELDEGGAKAAAAEWCRAEELDGWEVADAESVISDLRRLAKLSQVTGQGVYLWVSP